MENLWCLNRIQSLELSTEQQIEFASFDYRDYEHEDGDVVYADPPYAGTGKYDKRDFDHEAFWEWARTRGYPVYVSEYNAPDDFTCIWQKAKLKLAAGGKTARQKATEHLFIHKKWKEN